MAATHHLTTKLVDVSTNASLREFEGYGSTFGNRDLGNDVVVRGAFAKSLATHRANGTMPPLLWAHKPDERPLGKWLDMREDDHGLYVRGRLSNTQPGLETFELLRDGSLTDMSIGFSIAPGGEDYDQRSGARLLRQIELWELSLVSMGMNPRAKVTPGSVKDDAALLRDIEQHAHARGMTKDQARMLYGQAKLIRAGKPVPSSGDWRSNFADSNLLDAIRAARETVRGLRWTR